ncbi:YraN family protein [Bremerella sp. JC770]|uniref:YraN family protein n=1 Tax=Bremerella sp. JC770 TaxID=3232137 RepID=UPI00345ADE09
MLAWIRSFWKPKSLGDRGERFACRFLRRQGYTIVARQDRTRLGEIDIIAVQKRTIVFVEVKTRAGDDKGLPVDAVNQEKQQRLTRAALAYMRRHDLLGNCAARFDVIAIVWPDDRAKPRVTHIENAFEPTGQFQMFS